MALFVISDLHLSLNTDKPMTVFKGWDNYVERIESNWRKVVNDEDTVVIPGDISWEMRLNNCKKDFEFIHNLPGKKIIMKGNHDLWWESMTKMNAFLQQNGFDSISIMHNNCYEYGDFALCGSRGWYYDDVADKKVLNREVGRIKTSLEAGAKTGKELILFLHYPPLTTDSVCEEIMSVIKQYGVRRCYYGHIHRGGRFKAYFGEYENILFRCVSCDLMDFMPFIIEK